MIAITIPGRPIPWSRAGSNHGRRYTPAKQTAYMHSVSVIARNAMSRAGMTPIEGPIEMTYRATYAWPQTWSQKDRDRNGKWRIGKSDCDNLVKVCMDAMQGIVFENDAQIVSLHATKVYGLPCNEGVVVTVVSLAEELVEAA